MKFTCKTKMRSAKIKVKHVTLDIKHKYDVNIQEST